MLSPEQIDSLCAGSASRVQQLRDSLRACGSALVAFSGGVDSAFVLKIALDELGERAVALTALSASVAPDEAERRFMGDTVKGRNAGQAPVVAVIAR